MTREGEKKRFSKYTKKKKIVKMYANFLGGNLLFQTYGKLRVSLYMF